MKKLYTKASITEPDIIALRDILVNCYKTEDTTLVEMNLDYIRFDLLQVALLLSYSAMKQHGKTAGIPFAVSIAQNTNSHHQPGVSMYNFNSVALPLLHNLRSFTLKLTDLT